MTLVVACVAVLAAFAQTSAADPVSGVLEVAGATATQQLDAVAHDATTAVPLPAAAPDAAQVSASAEQSVAAVPQDVAGATDAARSSADGASGRTAADAPRESDAHSGSGDRPLSTPPATALHTLTKDAQRVVASPTTAPDERATIVPAVRRAVSSHIARLEGTLAATTRRLPAAHALGAHASRVVGTLLGAVATSARDTLSALPLPTTTSLLRASPMPSQSTLRPIPGDASAAPEAQSSIVPTALTASLATIESTHFVPSGFSAFDLPSAQLLTTLRRLSRNTLGDGFEMTLPATSATPPSAPSLTNAPAAATLPAAGDAVPPPSPGGFSPTSSAGVASGLSAMTFLALAALLLLAGPRAMRRLRRAGASWRLAQFALIPARPG